MTVYTTKLQIASRAAQHCGIKRPLSLADNSVLIGEFNACYDQLRVDELSHNLWRFATKNAVLRPIDGTTAILTPPVYSGATAYQPGAIVRDANGDYWSSTVNFNTNNTPGTDGAAIWDRYFGPLTAMPFDASMSSNGGYFAGELVYMSFSAGVFSIYVSLVSGNDENPNVTTPWDSTVTYYRGQIVSFGATNYQAIAGINLNNEPDTSPTWWTTTLTFPAVSNKWLELSGATGAQLVMNYPLGSGPASDSATLNVYRLPNGYLRRAPQDPTAGRVPLLGGPSLNVPDDYVYEGPYFTSACGSAINYRFVGDTVVISGMDTVFCEGLAARVAMEVVERVTQAPNKLAACTQAYAREISQAKMLDAIERGPATPWLDPYIACRA